MKQRPTKVSIGTVRRKNAKLVVYGVVMMAAFNFFSHGTQDIYRQAVPGPPAALHAQPDGQCRLIFNIGAIIGGICFGYLSQKIGRRHAIIAACSSWRCWLWALSQARISHLAIAAFFMQIGVQGAWGVVPVHLERASPSEIRGTFPGFVYQLGNFVASFNAPIQVSLAMGHGGSYGYALALVAGIVSVLLIILMIFGPEARNVSMAQATEA